MDRLSFMWILESALLNYDGVTYEQLLTYGATPKEAKAGIQLCDYLESIQLNRQPTPSDTTDTKNETTN